MKRKFKLEKNVDGNNEEIRLNIFQLYGLHICFKLVIWLPKK